MRLLLLSGLLLFAGAASAVIETYEFEDELLRERYQALSFELRCPKCQNQNISDSNAPIAQDLRAQLYEQLHQGRSDQEIVDYMVARYGEFVLYRPRWNAVTFLLWLAPVLLLLGAAWILTASLRRRTAQGEAAALSAEEEAKLQALLGEEKPNENRGDAVD
jgi:cytochrome c-type biogenesis protein CcmH